MRAFCAEATARGVAVAAVDADEVDALTSVGTLRPALKGATWRIGCSVRNAVALAGT
jgi:hypothetical protein